MIKQFLYYIFVSSTLDEHKEPTNLIPMLNLPNLNPILNPPELSNPYEYETPLIPRDVLLSNSDKYKVKLSSDGKVLSYMAPLDGVPNIWVQPLDEILSGANTARAVTFEKGRGISDYDWTYKEGLMIYQQDAGGDENFVLYKLDVRNPRAPIATVLTDTEGVQALLIDSNGLYPDVLTIALNNRDPRFNISPDAASVKSISCSYHDLYRLNLETGEKELLLINKGFMGFAIDHNLQLRLAHKMNDQGGMNYYRRNPNDSVVLYKSVGLEDHETTTPIGFDKSNTKMYWLSSEGRDLNALYIADFANPDRKELIFEPQKGDLDTEVWMHPTEHVPLAVKEEYGYPTIHILNETLRTDFEYLETLERNGRLDIPKTSTDMQTWLVSFIRDDGPVAYYVYLRSERKAKFLFSSPASLLKHKHSKMTPVEVRTRDGYTQLCYVSIPVEFDTLCPHVPSRPLPLLMYVHGGPWERDSWKFDATTQLFANRGYAVMRCNFRSSTGYGKNWGNAGNGEWGRKMHHDLLDAVEWAIGNGIADKSRIGIVGGSYGGYATLAALTFTPNTFKCGVDLFGPSNLETFINVIPPYWKSLYNKLVKGIGGDPATEEGREFLASRSPINFVHKIKSHLLIFQGANDPRVKQNESDQMVAAMKSHNITVSYVLFPDEGHGFVRPENRLASTAIIEQFLASCLGGRAEPARSDVRESSAQMIEMGNLCSPSELK